MKSLTEKLTEITGAAFEACGLPPELGRVSVSDRPDLAQFQCNGAMAAAKQAKKNPREVAQAVVDYLSGGHPERSEGSQAAAGDSSAAPQNDIFSKIEIAGPGFINLNITDDYLAAHLKETAGDARFGAADDGRGATVVLDYGGPNIAKPMHVGHLRTAIIGDSLRRVMAFGGFRTLADVHMGDWGTHMGMIISEYLATGQAERVLATDLDDEAAVAALMEELSALYPQVAAACKEDEARRALALEATVKIQNKEPDHYKLWEVIRAASVRGMKANYELLDVHFDLWKGEAHVNDLIPEMVAELTEKNLAAEDDGATIIRVAQDDDKKEMPPLILYKRDGAVMYGTTDLATILERMREFRPSKIIYVVDQRQHLHFEQVFRAARLAGFAPENVELTHAGFGTMNGTDGKPFKTRAGGVMKLEDLLAMGLEKARERMEEAEIANDLPAAEKESIAHKVAIAAIKFADLQNQRQQDYVFDLDRLTSFEGKTGPYLLYQAVRIKSLLRKADDQITGLPDDLKILEEDRPLALLLTAFPESFAAALSNYAPHHLCDYAFRLAQEFSRFYGSCHILSEEDAAVKASRLALCALTVRVLETVLDLLGISVPERM